MPGRPVLRLETLLLLASVAFAAFYNRSLWGLLFAGADTGATATVFAGLFIAVVCLQFAGLALLVPRRLAKPILMLLFLATALASHYMDQYGVLLDKDMLRNVLHTDPAEASELLTASLLPDLLLHVLLPATLLLWVRIEARPLGGALMARGGAIVVALAVAVGMVALQYREVSSLVRSHREARHLVTPTNYLVALYKLSRDSLAAPPRARQPIGLDAHRIVLAGTRRPTLLVLAIGETVRSANFGLSGYARDNTPELRQLGVITYPRVQACGTSTEVSVPCMFARVGRRDYDEARILGEESLLHVLDRAGIRVQWIDNQAGCKGVCTGLATEQIARNPDPELCREGRCLDEVLLSRLAAAVEAGSGDMVVVLHMLGNHGPAYSHRYPPEFGRFQPACTSQELRDCTADEIVNAYDNAVLYTDHVLAGVIRYLETLGDRDTGLIYVSDHGESLGEGGLYLHGLPWRLAPATQKEVPMVAWLSPGLLQSSSVDGACLRDRATHEGASHDNLFHSVLGLAGVETTAREPELDLFAPCRVGSPPHRLAQEPRGVAAS